MPEVLGRLDWNMTRDDEGHREYKIKWLVHGLLTDGPANVMLCPGLPTIGSTWAFDGDLDLWAWCRPNMAVSPVLPGEPNEYWTVEQTFSTKPIKRCQDSSFENPLDEPIKIGGSYNRYQKLLKVDKDGVPLVNSAKELLPSEVREDDEPYPVVTMSQNVAALNLPLITSILKSPLNDAPLWGLPARCVKFSNFTFDMNFYGTCSVYYTPQMEFQLSDNGFDESLPDAGYQRVKEGVVDPPVYPDDYETNLDDSGVPQWTLLDGTGRPHDDPDNPVMITVRKKGESNLLLLGIPAALP